MDKAGWVSALSPLRWLIIQALCFFLAAGRLAIPRAWVFYGIGLIGSIVSFVFTIFFIRTLANQRGKAQKGTKRWDVMLLSSYFLIYLLVVPIIAGLDIGRFQWSYLGWVYLFIGLIIYVSTFVIIPWSMIENEHFEGTVRIQSDRDHQVISSGPYRWVRHPGYVGMILLNVSIPLMIGSVYALIPSAVCIFLVIVRTALEDKTLRLELTGYKEYAAKTRFRLVPGIW